MNALDMLLPEQSELGFFSKERKNEIVDKKLSFFVTAVELMDPKPPYNKAQWVMSLTLTNADVESGKIGFATPSTKRDMIFDALHGHFQENPTTPYGPLSLYRMKNETPGFADYIGIARSTTQAKPTIERQSTIDQAPF